MFIHPVGGVVGVLEWRGFWSGGGFGVAGCDWFGSSGGVETWGRVGVDEAVVVG